MAAEVHQTSSGTFTIENGIMIAIMLTPDHTLEHARENIIEESRVLDGRKVPLLVDLTRLRSIERRARQFYGSAEGVAPYLAIALLISSPVTKVIGNFFMGLNKLPRPTKLFTSREEAITWLEGYKT